VAHPKPATFIFPQQTGGAPSFAFFLAKGGLPRTQLTFNPATNQISSNGFAYDAAGNMTNDTTHTYTYDAEGNITTVGRFGTSSRWALRG